LEKRENVGWGLGENVGWGLDTYACSLNVDFEMPVLHALKNAER